VKDAAQAAFPVRREAQHSNVPGILAMLAGTIAFVCNDSIVKLLGTHLPPGEIMALRGTVSSLLLVAICAWYGALRWPAEALRSPAFSLRLVGDVGATCSFVISLMHMRFADASGIQQFQPLAITAGSAMFLAEPVGWRRWLAALVGLIGVLLIIKPGSGSFEPFALLSALCVVFVATSDISTRLIGKTVPSLLLALCSALAVTAAGLVFWSGEIWVLPQSLDWLGLGVTGVLVVAGLKFVITAVQIADLSVVSPFRYSSVIYAVALQIGIWAVVPDPWTFLGVVIVVGAGLYTFHREHVRRAGRT
jgi:drug/metabolite transporter (DMT)-like permease